MSCLMNKCLATTIAVTLLALAIPTTQAQTTVVAGQRGVYVQGNGQGVAGMLDENGFRGIVVGPDGRVRQITGQPSAVNPFLKPAGPSGKGKSARMHSSAFAGAAVGETFSQPGSFNPFEFVFGRSAGAMGGMEMEEPISELNMARRAFRMGQYDVALAATEKAAQVRPGAADIEQMRALILFAQKKFEAAAAPVWTVMNGGMVWDWPSLREMYPSQEKYVEHFRVLQAAAADANATAGVHFVLAYHCIVLDQVDAARRELIKTRELQPDNRLVDELLAQLPPSIERP
jgi:hypothetical protein